VEPTVSSGTEIYSDLSDKWETTQTHFQENLWYLILSHDERFISNAFDFQCQ